MAVHGDFVPGCTYLTCSFCGRRRLFPDELAFCDDKKFRCLDACMEKSILSIDREIAASHYKREAPPLGMGYASQFDRGTTFLEDSIDARSIAIPGWTPSATLAEDFTVLPGAVGSLWSVTNTGTAAVSAPSVGVVRLSGGSGQCKVYPAATSVPSWGAGRFYARFRFNATPVSTGSSSIGASSTSAGVPFGTNAVLVEALTVPRITLVASGATSFSFQAFHNDGEYHTGAIWWKGDGYIHAIADDVPQVVRGSSSTLTAAVPYVTATFGATIDVTDYVAFT